MNIISRLILFIKNIFSKKEKINMLNAPKLNISQNKQDDFINSLRVVNNNKNTNPKIKTPICNGDGLGIQKKISY